MCFESSKSSSTAQNQFNVTDPWAQAAGQTVGQQATNYTQSNPYQGYSGATEASFGPTFGTAENAATTRANTTDPNFSAGTSSLLQGLGLAGATASAPVTSLMSQYTGAALSPTIDAIQRQADAANTGTATNATMAGAFGDTGYGTQKATNNYNTTQAISGATSNAYNTAYNTALGTQQTALGQLLGGVGQASGLGSASNTASTNLESLLGSLGATQQSAGQTGINTAINVNNQNQMGQLQQDALAGSTLNAVPKNSSSYGNSNTTQTQPDNTGLGLLGTLLAATPSKG